MRKSPHADVEIGDRFNRWQVVGEHFLQTRKVDGQSEWFVPCQCRCGTYRAVRVVQLKNGHSGSCGSCKGGITKQSQRLYRIRRGMIQRCMNPMNGMYLNYGARGISICQEWQKDFASFRDWAFQNGYADGLTLDRIDNDGNYKPMNCRWVSHAINTRNKRGGRFLTAFGEKRCLAEWVRDSRCNVSYSGLKSRILRGIPPELAIASPPAERSLRRWSDKQLFAFGESKSAAAWAMDPRCEVGRKALTHRIKVLGWSVEEAILIPPRRGRKAKRHHDGVP